MIRALSLALLSALVLAAGSPAGGEEQLVLVRPQGSAGPLVAYAARGGELRFRLPAGRVAADRSVYYAATAAADGTRLRGYSPADGALRSSWTIPDARLGLAAVSPNGRWAVLGRRGVESSFAVVDGTTGSVVDRATLSGDFEVEAIDAAGKRLFLIEHAAGRRYVIRLYDVAKARLDENPLVSKGSAAVMAGYAWDAVGSPDGRWLLTLYLSTARNLAFVHVLDLSNRVAVCVNLPSAIRGLGPLSRYVLTLAPGGSALYATNPVLGVVAELNLEQRRVVSVVRFRPVRDAPRGPAVVSPDGRGLALAAGRTVRVYDTLTRRIGPARPAGGVVAGLAFAGDGSVRVVRRDGRMRTLAER